LLGGNGQTAGVGHGDEVAEVPELHSNLPYPTGMGPAYKVFFRQASDSYSRRALYAGACPPGRAYPDPDKMKACACAKASRRRCCSSWR
jgi:hypothetical protein